MSDSAAFLAWLDEFQANLKYDTWEAICRRAGGPDRVALLIVDMVNGFCKEGALASPRVGALIEPVCRLLLDAGACGVERVLFFADTHPGDAREFAAFPPHCLAGTAEAEVVAELLVVPAAAQGEIVPKNSLCSVWAGDWHQRLVAAGTRAVVVAGDCTDLCVYHLAMPLLLHANQAGYDLEVIVPANCVETYDLPVPMARSIGAMPHDGDLLHKVFLYHMALNGVRVVASIKECRGTVR